MLLPLLFGATTDCLRVAGDDQPSPATPRNSELVFPPPPQPLVDSHGGQRLHVESILNSRDVKGQRTSYLVRWRGYPHRTTRGCLAPS